MVPVLDSGDMTSCSPTEKFVSSGRRFKGVGGISFMNPPMK
jgi:hypothetical protein